MNNQDENTLIGIVVILGIVLFPIYKFSRYIGADFDVTLRAVVISILGLGVAITFSWFFMREHIKSIITFTLMLIWYNWWPVLDNAANNRPNHFLNESIWWDSNLFKITILLLLLSLSIYLFFREKNKWHY